MRLSTSLRGRQAVETWQAVCGMQASLGISRVTDITRLDRLGLPVFASVRPRGWTLRVHAGKGLELEEARTGALMEALETEVAEYDAFEPPDETRALGSLESGWPRGLRAEHFAPQVGAELSDQEPWPAVSCELLGDGGRPATRVLLPDQMVRLPWPGRVGPDAFPWSSNGLASGNSLDEATLHALLEILERDTLALHSAVDASRRLRVLPTPFDAWAERWRSMGIELLVRELPNEFGLPCFEATLHEPDSAQVNLASGSGLHLDRDIALARAVTEAAQSRLSTLHGGRDDVTLFYRKYEQAAHEGRIAQEARLHQERSDIARSVSWEDVPNVPIRGTASALTWLLRHMRACAFPWVFRHRLVWPRGLRGRAGLDVVKVVVPGCEMLERHNRRVGPRLRMRLAQIG
jgi:ribosomal protein S12 methylthiotransferase accessory factor